MEIIQRRKRTKFMEIFAADSVTAKKNLENGQECLKRLTNKTWVFSTLKGRNEDGVAVKERPDDDQDIWRHVILTFNPIYLTWDWTFSLLTERSCCRLLVTNVTVKPWINSSGAKWRQNKKEKKNQAAGRQLNHEGIMNNDPGEQVCERWLSVLSWQSCLF